MRKGEPAWCDTVRGVREGLDPGPGKAPEVGPRAMGSSEGCHLSPCSLGRAGSGWKVDPKEVTMAGPKSLWPPHCGPPATPGPKVRGLKRCLLSWVLWREGLMRKRRSGCTKEMTE